MSSTLKLILMLAVTVVIGFFAIQLVFGLLWRVAAALIPLLIIGGIGYFIYSATVKKSLGGNRRTLP
jgi:hypothetical protein